MRTKRVQLLPEGGRGTLTTKETKELSGDVNHLYLSFF